MSDTNIAFAAIAPDVNAEMSRMKPTASRTVSSAIPINAKNAALLRVMVEIIRPQLKRMFREEGNNRATATIECAGQTLQLGCLWFGSGKAEMLRRPRLQLRTVPLPHCHSRRLHREIGPRCSARNLSWLGFLSPRTRGSDPFRSSLRFAMGLTTMKRSEYNHARRYMGMPTYICLARWTSKGLENIKDSPSRLDAGRKLFLSTGVTLKEFFMVTGCP